MPLSIPAPAGEPTESCSPRLRSIPAPAGEPSGGRHGIVHDGTGLSPRLRGNHSKGMSPQGIQGSIPAPAGEPYRASHTKGPSKVYPRACGGTFTAQSGRRLDNGLSPRLRGNPRRGLSWCGAPRSIPAPAGEPRHPCRQRTCWPVYPRACGGTRSSVKLTKWASGLSPRLRGNPALREYDSGRLRSIPAPAGEPRVHHVYIVPDRVYLRACGGTWSSSIGLNIGAGLSPRLRGNPPQCRSVPPQCRSVPPQCRSIPAPAGEP